MQATQALAGFRVIEIGNLVAAPFAARILAEFGAEVIKIEAPEEGDPLRKWRKLHEGTSLWWYVQARNKKSMTLNLKSEEGQKIVRELCAKADIVIENFRPGALEKLNLGFDTLSKLNPKLVMVRISGYGQSGPYRDQPGFGVIGEAMGGIRHTTGTPELPSARTGISLGDSVAALYGVIGALMAVIHARIHGGNGQVVDVSLYESVFNLMESLVPEYDLLGFIRERSGSALPGICPSNSYPCADGRDILIAGNGDAIYKRLMQAIGHPDLADAPQLAHNDGRAKNSERIDNAIGAWTRQHQYDEVLDVLRAADVPVGGVYSVADIVKDPQYAAREMIETHRLPDGTAVKFPGIAPKMSATPGATTWLGPKLGEHTNEVLAMLGYDQAEILSLRERRVI